MKTEKKVKGTIFSEYVRMIKIAEDVDWGQYLTDEDLAMLDQMIIPSSWYPLDSYKRMGLAVFKLLARGDVDLAWQWGRSSMDDLVEVYKNLVSENDPLDTIWRFSQFRSRFVNFDWAEFEELSKNKVRVIYLILFEDEADKAYAYQLGGIMERLIELAGAQSIKVDLTAKCWEGDPNTVFEVSWEI